MEKIHLYLIGRCLSLRRKVLNKSFFLGIGMLLMFIHVDHLLAKEETEELANEATSAFIMEADTGQILYNKNAEEKLPPASMTKIMTLLLIMESLEEGSIELDDKVTTSKRAASMGGSQIFLEEGEEMTVDEMLKGIAVASGNDASVAMAEYVAGTEEKFIDKMNEKAKELGLENTTFQNTTGLPSDDHYTTAQDLAVISQALLRYENVLEYTSLYEDYLREGKENEFWLVNTNPLVRHYNGVDGLKTGFTKEAKYNLTATAEKDGMRIITVLMGAESPKERNRLSAELLDFAFQNHDYHVLAEKGEDITEVTVEKGKQSVVPITLRQNAAVVLRKGRQLNDIKRKVIVSDSVTAPAKQHDEVGTLQFYENGELLTEKSLVLKDEAPSASWAVLFKRTLSTMTGKLS
ncbi:D-alanyl-D-alanine carboxypeptidase [Salibacterium salarium]|uniref:serine-type D-Ala-D-Ala carboxypeptidase n=1 Tax=Salibacterium salarium TaxID=284579 RepID=A0A3R9QW28_9BACI|nr:D-alanyl-D-alanine carboxypeptidase [Salibacterium salarium]